MTRNPRLGAVALVLFALTVLAANAALNAWGVWHIGPASVPSGALFAGFAFTFRDVGQDHAGLRWTVAAIAVGIALSAWVNPQLAAASAVAFGAGELFDLAVYTPLRDNDRRLAVVLSGLVGGGIDTWLFLWLSPLPATFALVLGMMAAKYLTVAAAAALIAPNPAPARPAIPLPA